MSSRAIIYVIFSSAFIISNAIASVDLGIADDETFKRPNAWAGTQPPDSANEKLLLGDSTGPASRPGVSIAWRNANQVEEVEVRVRNLGDEPAEGNVFVDILDESGMVLLHLIPPDDQKTIRIPAHDRGGKDGKIIRMKASWELNALIDRFDISRTRYHVRATVQTTSAQDANLLDNSKVKSWNIPSKVRPGMTNSYNYIFKNNGMTPVNARWLLEHTPYPTGWRLEGVPTDNSVFTLAPGESVVGALSLTAPKSIAESDFLETRLSLVDVDKGEIFLQNEWFQIYDTKPPTVTDYRLILLDDGTIAIQALVADSGSGILEATGVSTEFSVDGGRTWARKAHNYKVGNFVRPTLFETVLGPFRKGTSVQLRFTALDTAGNTATIIPQDAAAFAAPKQANQLLSAAYVFPRTAANPIFEINKLKDTQKTLKILKKQGVDLNGIDFSKPNILGVDPKRLEALNMGPERFPEIVDDLKRVEKIQMDFGKVNPVKLKRVGGDIDRFLNVTTMEVQAK